jgi:hypothetical protein
MRNIFSRGAHYPTNLIISQCPDRKRLGHHRIARISYDES